jgi:hypothetical protein
MPRQTILHFLDQTAAGGFLDRHRRMSAERLDLLTRALTAPGDDEAFATFLERVTGDVNAWTEVQEAEQAIADQPRQAVREALDTIVQETHALADEVDRIAIAFEVIKKFTAAASPVLAQAARVTEASAAE